MPDPLPRAAKILQAGIDAGLHLGAQLAVRRHGEPVADLALGQSRPGVAMTADTLTLWLSAGKPATAVGIALLADRGLIDPDAPVATYLPAFAANGKGGVTVAHVLTHTGGFRPAAANTSAEPWDAVLDKINAAPLEPGWTPGEKAGYHVASGWYILGELIRRADPAGRMPDVFLRQEVFEPLGMADCWVGMPPDVYEQYGDRIGLTFDTSKNVPTPLAFFNGEAGSVLCRPGGNARGPVNQLALLYDELLRCRGDLPPPPNRPPLLTRRAALLFTGRRRDGMFDETFKRVIDWGYGFLIDSKRAGGGKTGEHPYGYGPHASPATFGHGGNQSSSAFADPAHALSVAWAANGLPGEAKHQHRAAAVNGAIYEDLGLA